MKKVFCFLVSVLMLIGACAHAVDAADEPCISVGHASGHAGETVTLPIEIADNPGLIAIRLSVQYDTSKLQFLGATDGGLFGNDHACFGNSITENPYTLLWEDGLTKNNYDSNGKLAILSFKILEGASSSTTDVAVSLDAGSTFNVDMQNVAFSTENGSIRICDRTISDSQITGVSVQDLTLYYKEYGSLQTQVLMAGQAEYKIVFQPENEELIKIDEKGNATTLHWGKTDVSVTVTDTNGNTFTKTCAVEVKCHVWQWLIIIFLFGWIWY